MPATITGVNSYDNKIIGFSVWDHPAHLLFSRPNNPAYTKGKGHVAEYPEVYGTTEDYRGKNFLCAKGTLGHLTLMAVLRAVGLTEKDVNVIHMEIPAAFQAFKAGEGDFIVMWGTFPTQAVKEGWVEVASAEKAGLLVPSAIQATETILKKDPETLQKIMNILVRGMVWVDANKDEAAQVFYEMCQEEGVNATLDYCRRTLADHDSPTIAEMEAMFETDGYRGNIQNVMDFYLAAGSYNEAIRTKVIGSFDGSYLKKAIENFKQKYQ